MTGRSLIARTLVGGALAGALVACSGSSGSGGVVSVGSDPNAAPSSAPPAAASAPPGPALPALAAAPAVRVAQASVRRSLSDLQVATQRVVSGSASAALVQAANVLNAHLSSVQTGLDQAVSRGEAGDCAGSFAASRASADAFLLVKKDVGAIGRVVSSVRRAHGHYGQLRLNALKAMQGLYNAVAGHPLESGPSSDAEALRTAMASDDRATAAAAAYVSTVQKAAQNTLAQAKKVAGAAALAVCLEVPHGGS
jgi:hypothetical protein